MTVITIATGNPHKVDEIRSIFKELGLTGVELRSLAESTGGVTLPEPEEHGATFAENASIKARAYAERVGGWCLADDSGLEIDALGGRPGVISSHYFNDGRTDGPAAAMSRAARDRANNERVLRELASVGPAGRTARFVCVMALADTGGVRALSRGTFEGRIGMPGDVPRGDNGFGYDPIFLVGTSGSRTSAELSPTEKNALSHRGAAAREMAAQLRSVLAADGSPGV